MIGLLEQNSLIWRKIILLFSILHIFRSLTLEIGLIIIMKWIILNLDYIIVRLYLWAQSKKEDKVVPVNLPKKREHSIDSSLTPSQEIYSPLQRKDRPSTRNFSIITLSIKIQKFSISMINKHRNKTKIPICPP